MLDKGIQEMGKYADKIYAYLAEYGVQLLAAVAIFIIGRWIAKIIAYRLLGKALEKTKVEATLVTFFGHVTYFIILITVIVAALAKLGVPTAQYVAALGAAGLAIGLALQGSLSNFAAGILLIIFKPFKVGDYVAVAGVQGTVREVQIFTTVLDTADNIRIIVPNAQITGGTISNYNANDIRRIDLKIGVSYEDDLKKAKQVIEAVLGSDARILKKPAPVVAISELADSSVNFVVWPWVKAKDLMDVKFEITEKLKTSLEANGLTIPFPQYDLNIRSNKALT